MRIESGGNDHQVCAETFQGGESETGPCSPELSAAGAWWKRQVEDVSATGFGRVSGAGVQRHLVAGDIEHLRGGFENRLRSVAVMHVEIQNGDPPGAMCSPAITGDTCDGADNNCDGNIDEDDAVVWHLDGDADGYGSATETRIACVPCPC